MLKIYQFRKDVFLKKLQHCKIPDPDNFPGLFFFKSKDCVLISCRVTEQVFIFCQASIFCFFCEDLREFFFLSAFGNSQSFSKIEPFKM
jgi:hypothetical protein